MAQITALDNAEWMTSDIRLQLKNREPNLETIIQHGYRYFIFIEHDNGGDTEFYHAGVIKLNTPGNRTYLLCHKSKEDALRSVQQCEDINTEQEQMSSECSWHDPEFIRFDENIYETQSALANTVIPTACSKPKPHSPTTSPPPPSLLP